ncbi:MAG: hypothetical protein Q9178_007350 [Gyalolechia marmorata]
MADITVRLGALERENFEYKVFVPFNELKKLFTRDRVYELLRQHDIEFHLVDEIVGRVLNGGLKTFAILGAIQAIGSITRFIKKDQLSGDYLDARLPLKDTDIPLYFSDLDKGKLFLRRQWSFLAPVFSDNLSCRELDDRIILPFLHRAFIAQGGFAKVYKMTVDASHYLSNTSVKVSTRAILEKAQDESKSTQSLDLICKQLERPDAEGTLVKEFEHEVSILSALRCLQHPNIIPLVTAFSKGTIYSFLFPVADGDLQKLLKNNYRLPGFQTDIEIFCSLWGLSSALDAVHNYFFSQLNVQQIGCHYDIKPRNILFSNGTLLLSDFGLSRLRNAEDGSQTTFKKGEGDYMAPECESIREGFKRGRIGRASDIWSFGCVLAEILAYLSVEPAKGPTTVQYFTEDRRLKVGSYIVYDFFSDKEINPGVRRLLERCEQNPSGGLKLLARIVEKILQFDPDQRPPSADVTRLLFHLTQQTRVSAITSTFSKDMEPLDFELEIEMERLKIWSEMVGLNADPLDVPGSTWFAAKHSFDNYTNLQLLLTNIQTEFSVIATELQKSFSGQPTFRLYYRLQQLQDQLWDGQPLVVRRTMFGRLQETMLSKDNPARSQEALELVQGTLRDTPDRNRYSSSTELFCRRFASLVTMRNVASALVRQDRQNQNLRLNRESIKGPWSELGPHTVANLEPESEHVLIEFLTYEKAWTSHEDELLERVNAIASLRSGSVSESIFPILQCRGYYPEPTRNRFGIVYQLPPEAKDTVPINLSTVIKRTKPLSLQPSLTQRYKLAAALVSHVLDFHRGGWLHKGISALNIICFPDAFPSIAASLSAPFFIGFNHSRMDDDNAYSSLSGPEIEYQHPVYQRNALPPADNSTNAIVRFRQEFDYYSVGMVLMEIAFWRPLKSITESIEGSPKMMLAKLLEKYVPLVKTCMGDMYGAAVQYCLTMYVEEQKEERSSEDIRDGFNENVVMPISKCLV